jgi:glutathione S-transferase
MEQGVDAPFFGMALGEIDKFLGEMEAALARTAWLAGDAFSLADVALMPYLARFEFLGLASLWANRQALAGWLARVKARPSFDRVLIADVAPTRMAAMLAHGSEQAARLSRTVPLR